MLQVDKNLCSGCALCAQICPQGAVRLFWGKAEIDATKCNFCYQCVDACPQEAIVEIVSVLPGELRVTVSSLGQQADDIIRRIDSLLNKA